MKNEEIKNINYQLFGLGITIITVIISILLTYNELLIVERKPRLFSKKNTFNITLFNRALILLIALLFLYVNYRFLNADRVKGKDTKNSKLQITASYLVIISGIIALYVVLNSSDNLTDIENPNI